MGDTQVDDICQALGFGSVMRVLFVAPSLNTGGAERFTLRLTRALVMQGVEASVVSLADKGDLIGEFSEADVPVHTLGLGSGTSLSLAAARVSHLARRIKPDSIQGMMYLGDIFATVASLSGMNRNLFWSIRTSKLPPSTAANRRLLPFALAPASHLLPRRIISCSQGASDLHVRRGYARSKIVHIPNSVENWALNARIESRLLNGSSDPIRLGLAARYDPGKGHLELVQAVALLRQRGHNVEATFIGRGTGCGEQLEVDLQRRGLGHVPVYHGGLRGVDGTRQWMSEGLDLYVMASSRWEAFPNALAEAATAGLPSMATNVGASWSLIAKIGELPGFNPNQIATGVAKYLAYPREHLLLETSLNSARLRGSLSSECIARRYLSVWQQFSS